MFHNTGKTSRYLVALAVLGIACGILLILTTDKAGQAELNFQTIEKGETTNVFTSGEAKIVILTRPEDGAKLNGFISSVAEKTLQELDYDAFFAMAVFQGRMPSSGYSVEIERVTHKGNIVTVYTRFVEPQPDQEKQPELRSPYHLVLVEKTESGIRRLYSGWLSKRQWLLLKVS